MWPFGQSGGKSLPIGPFHLLQDGGALVEIDGPAVVGVDHGQIPEFRPLVEIRHPRHHRLQRDLAQRVKRAQQRHPPC